MKLAAKDAVDLFNCFTGCNLMLLNKMLEERPKNHPRALFGISRFKLVALFLPQVFDGSCPQMFLNVEGEIS